MISIRPHLWNAEERWQSWQDTSSKGRRIFKLIAGIQTQNGRKHEECIATNSHNICVVMVVTGSTYPILHQSNLTAQMQNRTPSTQFSIARLFRRKQAGASYNCTYCLHIRFYTPIFQKSKNVSLSWTWNNQAIVLKAKKLQKFKACEP